MRALDTPVLLAFLTGSPKAREILRKLRGAELATTEANLLELAAIAGQGPARARAERLASLTRLRQRLTVLPLDSRATVEAARRLVKAVRRSPPHLAGMLGALEANGCEELLTDDPGQFEGEWRFRVRKVSL